MIILANGGVWIDAQQDYLTCPCGVIVAQGQMCTRCKRRTLGPCVENQTRKILTEEQDGRKRQQRGDA